MTISSNGTTLITENTSIHRKMLNVLHQDGLGLGALWTVGLSRGHMTEIVNEIYDPILGIKAFEHDKWNVSRGVIDNKILSPTNWVGDYYFMLAQSVSFPGDSVISDRPQIMNSGFSAPVVTKGRAPLNTARLTVLETETAISDFVLRPWSVLLGHRSLKDSRIRKNIDITMWKIHPEISTQLIPRKSLTLTYAAPISLAVEELMTTNTSNPTFRQVELVYDTYYITTGL